MALLFVPLTTVSMAAIERDRMGYATSLFNLMRNIGGSIGIAITSTILQRQRQVTGTQLGEHVTIYDDVTQSVFDQIRARTDGGRHRRGHRHRSAPTPCCTACCSARRRWCRS